MTEQELRTLITGKIAKIEQRYIATKADILNRIDGDMFCDMMRWSAWEFSKLTYVWKGAVEFRDSILPKPLPEVLENLTAQKKWVTGSVFRWRMSTSSDGFSIGDSLAKLAAMKELLELYDDLIEVIGTR